MAREEEGRQGEQGERLLQEKQRVTRAQQLEQKQAVKRLFESQQNIQAQDIPFQGWPDADIVLGLLDGEEGRMREEVRRWHPDKFLQRFGGRIQEQNLDSVMERVKRISQVRETKRIIYFFQALNGHCKNKPGE